MIKNIVFDIGKVLISFDWQPYITGLFDDEATVEAIRNAIWKSGLWTEMDRGILSDEELLNKMQAIEPDYADEIALAFEQSGDCCGKKAYAIPWIKDLKSCGYNVYFLSNYSQHIMQRAWYVLDFLPYMDGGVFSCAEHCVKPEPEIYKRLLDKYELEPHESVFLDDKPENIAAAHELGFETVLFTSYDCGRKELERLLNS